MGSVLSDIKNTYEVENQILFQAVNELKNGDEQAFDKVYKMSEKYIYSIINRITHDNEKTADLMQETYIQVYKKIDTLENAEAFLIWAGRIATNYTLRFIQKDSKEILSIEEDNDFIFERASDDKEEFLPEDILLNKEKKNKIHDIINNLSTEQKITIQYYYFADMSVGEIAEEMQCSTGTVKSRLNYARKNIKEIVLDTEKKEGIKLHSLSGLPLLLLLFREEVAYAAVPKVVSSSVVKGIADAVGVDFTKSLGLKAVEVGKKGIKELVQVLLKTTSGKVISGIAVTAVVGTVAVTQIPEKADQPVKEPIPISETLYITPNMITEYTHYKLEPGRIIGSIDMEFAYLIDKLYIAYINDYGQEGVYTLDGKEILSFEFDDILYNENTGGLFRTYKDSKVAYYDKSGKMICDSMYDRVSDVFDGLFWCYDLTMEKYKIFSIDGRQVSKDSFEYIGEMVNGMAIVINDDKYGLLKNDGEYLLDIKYHSIYLGDGEYIAVNEVIDGGLRRTILDNAGNLIFTEDSDKYVRFTEGFYNGVGGMVYQSPNGHYDYPVKVDGTVLFDPTASEFLYICQNGFFLYQGNQNVLYNSEGMYIATSSWDGHIEYVGDKFIIKNNDSKKYSLVDDTGEVIIPEYSSIDNRYKGKYFICYDDNGYNLYKNDGALLFGDARDIRSIGCEMFLCYKADKEFVVNGQDGKSFMLLSNERIVSDYSDGYAMKLISLQEVLEVAPDFKYEIIDKWGDVKHEVYTTDKNHTKYINVIVLKEGLYSYMHGGNTYIKTW